MKDLVSSDIGDQAEIAVIHKFIKEGIPVSIPFGNNNVYDLVITTSQGFKSIQVKHGRLRNNCILASLTKKKRIGHNKYLYINYKGLVDYIIIYCDEIDNFYIGTPESFNTYTISLRLKETKSGKQEGIRWAKDYELDKFLPSLK